WTRRPDGALLRIVGIRHFGPGFQLRLPVLQGAADVVTDVDLRQRRDLAVLAHPARNFAGGDVVRTDEAGAPVEPVHQPRAPGPGGARLAAAAERGTVGARSGDHQRATAAQLRDEAARE